MHRYPGSGRRLVCGPCKEQGELSPEGSRGWLWTQELCLEVQILPGGQEELFQVEGVTW